MEEKCIDCCYCGIPVADVIEYDVYIKRRYEYTEQEVYGVGCCAQKARVDLLLKLFKLYDWEDVTLVRVYV